MPGRAARPCRRARGLADSWLLLLAVTISLLGVDSRPAIGQKALAAPRGSEASGLPLVPVRTLSEQVRDGTWMSLDVSADGRTIVFDVLGDLYILPSKGGRARRITSGTAFNSQPRYSPDGRQLAFISDRSGSQNLWIADAGGESARQLSKLQGYVFGAVTSPAWSPDGQTIVVAQQLGATRPGPVTLAQARRWLLAAYDVPTGRMRWVSDTTAGLARAALGPAFGPEEGWIYASVDASPQVPWTELLSWRLARVHLATGRIEPEMDGQVGRYGLRPAVSHDGRYLVYATSSGSRLGLRLRDLLTDRERWLVREALDNPPAHAQVTGGDLVPGYAFTPDSKSLIASYGGKIHRITLATGHNVPIPFLAKIDRGLGALTVHQFTLPDTNVRTRSVLQPALSHDGRWVAFTALDRIWVMELLHNGEPAGGPRRLTRDSAGEFYPSWSPDGQWVAYSSWKDGEGGTLRRVRFRPDGHEGPAPSEQLAADTAIYYQTAVARDGSRVAAVRAALPPDRMLGPKFQAMDLALVWVPANGGSPQTIAPLMQEPRRSRYPLDQVYFTQDSGRVYVGLASWRWDGTERRQVLQVSGIMTGPPDGAQSEEDAAGVIAPNGRRALVARRYALFELGLPVHNTPGPDTLNLERTRSESFGAPAGSARRWGTALHPWISWSGDGRRVLFSQGGSLFLGDVRPETWTSFKRVDVPLMIPVDMPNGTLVLRGARIITMRGREVIERGDLVVRNNRIAAVGPLGRVAIPLGTPVFDVSGKTILPGYVDIHDHMYLPRGVHPQQCWQCLVKLAYGVTSGRDPQPDEDIDVFTYRERERAGSLLGPRVFSTGMAYFGSDPPIETLADARDFVHPYAEYFGTETVKIYDDKATGRRARQLLVVALKEAGLNGTAHTYSHELEVATAIDGLPGIEHTPSVRVYNDVTTMIARAGATEAPTYGAALMGAWQNMFRRYGPPWEVPKVRLLSPPTGRKSLCVWCTSWLYGPLEQDNLDALTRNAARVVVQGGRIAMGSHGDVPGLGVHYELWLYALGGMPNYDILRSATLVGATAIGHANDFGSLEPGKHADLQVLDKNPLDDIQNTTSIRYVMKNGRLYTADDLTEIWPNCRPLSSIYAWEPNDSSESVLARRGPMRSGTSCDASTSEE